MKGQGEETERPIWQREHLFPAKPEGAPYGVLLGKGEARSFSSLSHLEAHLVQWKEPGLLVWTPDSEYCFPPEEDARLLSVLRKRKSAISENDWSSARYRAFIAFLPLFYFLQMTTPEYPRAIQYRITFRTKFFEEGKGMNGNEYFQSIG